jgi:hypothetical protein
MARETIECAYCGEVCGTYYPAQTYGDPSDCHEAELDMEPYSDDDGHDFCDKECCDAWHGENDEPPEDEEVSE